MNDTVTSADRRQIALLGLAAHRFRVSAIGIGFRGERMVERDPSVAPIVKLNWKALRAVWKLEDAIAALEARGRGEAQL